jgi:hypothetical protein
MKKIIITFSLLLVTSCTDDIIYVTQPGITKTVTKTDTIFVGMQSVNLNVNWSRFSATSKLVDGSMVNAISDSGLSITHVGARLVYPKNNAVFMQSAVKDSNNTKLISLQVPTTDTAHLYVVAVYEGNGIRKALKMGVKKNINIPLNGTVNLTLDSLTLIDTEWYIDSIADTTLHMVNDTVRVWFNNASPTGVVKIRVNDPYQIANSTFMTNAERIVKFYGSGYEYGNPSGWRSFGIIMTNTNTITSVEKFWPYIDGSMFNLNGDYLIGRQGVIKATWQ